MDPAELTAALKREALAVGFTGAGVCRAGPPPHLAEFRQWLADGCAAGMDYLGRRVDAYAHPDGVLPGTKSLLMLAAVYRTEPPPDPVPGRGRVARYAWGDDYHRWARDRLERLEAWLTERMPGAAVRGVVDTAPLLERDFAQLAGLGWIGKNTLLIHPQHGSWIFLAALLTDVLLEPDESAAASRCGECRACLDACPTGALAAPYRLDARKCLSYWTIEAKGQIPEPVRSALGDRVFGCDACQDACPWNRRGDSIGDAAFRPRPEVASMGLAELLTLDDTAWRRRFRDSPLARAKRRGLLRNAAIALALAAPAALATLATPTARASLHVPIPRTAHTSSSALTSLAIGLGDAEPLVRGACAWALGQLGESAPPRLVALLTDRLAQETDAEVRQEILAAIERISPL